MVGNAPVPAAQKSSGLAARIGRFIARHRRNPLSRKLATLCRRYLAWHANLDYELESNGEAFVLEVLAAHHPRMIIDAGANVGDWTRAARRLCPSAVIHAFEVVPSTFDLLVERVGGLPDVQCRNIGLAAAEGSIVMRHFDAAPALSTASDYPHALASREIRCPVIAGDEYCAKQGIDRIDFLKIDVEGMEVDVLRGFEGMLRRRAVDLVQFEYGRVNILSGFLLRNFHTLFAERGYVVGKIFPGYVEFRDYDLADEDFLGPNYLACRSDRHELVAALGSQGVRQ